MEGPAEPVAMSQVETILGGKHGPQHGKMRQDAARCSNQRPPLWPIKMGGAPITGWFTLW